MNIHPKLGQTQVDLKHISEFASMVDSVDIHPKLGQNSPNQDKQLQREKESPNQEYQEALIKAIKSFNQNLEKPKRENQQL